LPQVDRFTDFFSRNIYTLAEDNRYLWISVVVLVELLSNLEGRSSIRFLGCGFLRFQRNPLAFYERMVVVQIRFRLDLDSLASQKVLGSVFDHFMLGRLLPLQDGDSTHSADREGADFSPGLYYAYVSNTDSNFLEIRFKLMMHS